jgi:hypothetical protein
VLVRRKPYSLKGKPDIIQTSPDKRRQTNGGKAGRRDKTLE